MHEDIFQRVNMHLHDNIRWSPVSNGGTSNYIYHGMRHDMPLILRINGASELTFGTDRYREHSVLTAIQPFNWSMQVLGCDPDAGWCVMKDHGEPISNKQLHHHHSLLQNRLLSMAEDFQLIVSPQRFSYPDLFILYQQRLNLLPEAAYWLNQLDQLVALYRKLPDISFCLVHHDLHKGNLLIDDSDELSLKIIDWEYAGVGNPWFDIAMLYTEFEISASDLSALPIFSELSYEEFIPGLKDAIQFNQLLAKLWYRIREENHL
ncbi:phosphotransferase [Oceanospirillum sediminis]|uniref:Phosphotransferase n=1 Tax=Oceanospirillum sediminis TaxID=2760088 RepID=A0A839IP46_9GAMM|nr:phosphotransferase [Oceanospirillum sediminis]MBB1486269.1 phosphotransferase [Oceanospirillum sediminis]